MFQTKNFQIAVKKYNNKRKKERKSNSVRKYLTVDSAYEEIRRESSIGEHSLRWVVIDHRAPFDGTKPSLVLRLVSQISAATRRVSSANPKGTHHISLVISLVLTLCWNSSEPECAFANICYLPLTRACPLGRKNTPQRTWLSRASNLTTRKRK